MNCFCDTENDMIIASRKNSTFARSRESFKKEIQSK